MGATATIVTGIAAIAGAGGAAYAGIKAKERAEDQADEIERRTRYEQERMREEGERLKGRQRAAYAASGVRVDEDTPLAVVQETQREVERDIREVGRRGYYAADVARTEGRDLFTGAMWQAGGTLLGGGARTAEMYQKYMK